MKLMENIFIKIPTSINFSVLKIKNKFIKIYLYNNFKYFNITLNSDDNHIKIDKFTNSIILDKKAPFEKKIKIANSINKFLKS